MSINLGEDYSFSRHTGGNILLPDNPRVILQISLEGRLANNLLQFRTMLRALYSVFPDIRLTCFFATYSHINVKSYLLGSTSKAERHLMLRENSLRMIMSEELKNIDCQNWKSFVFDHPEYQAWKRKVTEWATRLNNSKDLEKAALKNYEDQLKIAGGYSSVDESEYLTYEMNDLIENLVFYAISMCEGYDMHVYNGAYRDLFYRFEEDYRNLNFVKSCICVTASVNERNRSKKENEIDAYLDDAMPIAKLSTF